MAALAESLVDEWLNRQGFFTVRGIKHGVDEIDLLGVRPSDDGLEAWHVEVQASCRPIGYISPLPERHVPSFASSRTSAKQRPPECSESVSMTGSRLNTCRGQKQRREIQRGPA